MKRLFQAAQSEGFGELTVQAEWRSVRFGGRIGIKLKLNDA